MYRATRVYGTDRWQIIDPQERPLPGTFSRTVSRSHVDALNHARGL